MIFKNVNLKYLAWRIFYSIAQYIFCGGEPGLGYKTWTPTRRIQTCCTSMPVGVRFQQAGVRVVLQSIWDLNLLKCTWYPSNGCQVWSSSHWQRCSSHWQHRWWMHFNGFCTERSLISLYSWPLVRRFFHTGKKIQDQDRWQYEISRRQANTSFTSVKTSFTWTRFSIEVIHDGNQHNALPLFSQKFNGKPSNKTNFQSLTFVGIRIMKCPPRDFSSLRRPSSLVVLHSRGHGGVVLRNVMELKVVNKYIYHLCKR